MTIDRETMKHCLSFFIFLMLATIAYAEPDLSKISMHYDDDHNLTVIYAQEKLVDANTGLGAAYDYPGHIMQKPPEIVSLTLFGYHDAVQWQNIKTLTLTYGSKTYTHKAISALHGEDRDKSDDLVEAKYYEPVIVNIPLAIAKDVFNNDNMIVTSTPESINLTLTPQQMDRCRDLLSTIPSVLAMRPPNMKKAAPSSNGLPVTRTITEASSDATLSTTGTMLTPRFSMQCLAFVTISGKQVHQPNTALLIAEIADAPILEKEQNITLNYGDTHLNLTSNTHQTQASDVGTKMSARTYLIAYSRFLTISKAKNLSFTVGDTTVPISFEKMAGIREIARRLQH